MEDSERCGRVVWFAMARGLTGEGCSAMGVYARVKARCLNHTAPSSSGIESRDVWRGLLIALCSRPVIWN